MPSALLLAALLTAALDPRPIPSVAVGQDPEPPRAPPAVVVLDETVRTRAELDLDGASLAYDRIAGRLVLREEDGTPRASVFHVAYLLERPEDAPPRPITFCFNGGPGSSSVWLHLGAFGPVRVDLGPEGFDAAPPYRLVPNAHGLLELTDLVFVDPVTTGYSRAAEGVDDKDFHGVEQDVESVGEFVRLFLTRQQRWSSPVYLAGESYGTTRAAALADHLQQRHGIYPSGLVLVSSILDFQTARFDVGNDLPYALFLPTFAATARYHGRLADGVAPELEPFLDEVAEFARGDYTLALMRGDRLPAEERARIAERLARYTGLDADWIDGANLRIDIGRFTKELLRGARRTVGRLDSRYLGHDRDAVGERYEYDPSYAAIRGAYSMSMNQYVRADLGYESDLPYEILTGRVRPWKYDSAENRYLNVAEDLRRAMARNPALRVFVANGYYDLATPFLATHHTFDHLGLPAELRGNVTMAHYEAGHMMYVRVADLVALRRDLGAWYDEAR